MDFAKLAAERYSLRKFSDRPVEAEKLAAVLEAVKAFSPAPQSEQAAEAETAEEEERAEQSADAPEEAVQADGAVEAAEEQTAGESAEDADRPQGE